MNGWEEETQGGTRLENSVVKQNNNLRNWQDEHDKKKASKKARKRRTKAEPQVSENGWAYLTYLAH